MRGILFERDTRRFTVIFLGLLLAANSLGCEAMVRKFTRKSKQEKVEEPMVLAPEEYKGPQMTGEEKYRHYFFYWESWHDELIQSLTSGGNKKKQLDSAQETIKNLKILQGLLNPAEQKVLDTYIGQLNDLSRDIKDDIYNLNMSDLRLRAEGLKRDIYKRFSYSDVKDALL